MSKVTIGIPIYNDIDYLRLLLDTVAWYTCYEDYRVVVVDDGSPLVFVSDAVRELCATLDVEYLKHDVNRGVAAGWNTACKNAIERGSEIMVLLNSDIMVVPDWLRAAVYALETNKETGIVGSFFWEPINIAVRNVKAQMRLMHDQFWNIVYTFSPYEPKYNPTAASAQDLVNFKKASCWGFSRVMSPNGSAFSFLLDTYQRVGPFDENMLAFHEEFDFGVRCAMQGLASFGLPYPRVYHAVSRTFTEQLTNEESSRRFQDSKRVFMEKWDVPKGTREYAQVVHERVMPNVPTAELSYLMPTDERGVKHGVKPLNATVSVPVLKPVEYTFRL